MSLAWAASSRSITSSSTSSRSDWRRSSDSISDCRFSSSRGELTWPGIQPRAVPRDPGADLLDVGVCLGLLAPQVAFARLQGRDLVTQLAVALL